jgi:hypothetical protein
MFGDPGYRKQAEKQDLPGISKRMFSPVGFSRCLCALFCISSRSIFSAFGQMYRLTKTIMKNGGKERVLCFRGYPAEARS